MSDNIYQRDIITKLDRWKDRKEAYAIKGPRQSGKTTILRILQEKLSNSKVIFLNFEDPDVLEALKVTS